MGRQEIQEEREKMGKTSDVLFRKILCIHSCSDRMADLYIGHSEKKKKETFKSSANFGRSLQNVKTGDTLFTQSFPRTLSNN